jgi:hypothetical protein
MSHVCHVFQCEKTIPPRMLMCRAHWEMVPPDLQDAVNANFNPAQCKQSGVRPLPTREWLKAARQALTWAERGPPPDWSVVCRDVPDIVHCRDDGHPCADARMRWPGPLEPIADWKKQDQPERE